MKRIFQHTALLLICIIASGCGGPKRENELRFRQYFVKGEELYKNLCTNCHQTDGNGLGLLYPPLNDADFLRKNPGQAICIIRHGMQGELIVNGKTFNQQMPANQALTPIEIAEIMTYITNAWSNEGRLFQVKEVTGILDSCSSFQK